MSTEQEIVIYSDKEGVNIEVTLRDETIWLSQRQMETLSIKSKKTISLSTLALFFQKENLTRNQLSGNSGQFRRKYSI